MPQQVNGRPMEILLVEDAIMDARSAVNALRKGSFQYHLNIAMDGEEAMQFLLHQGRFARAPMPDLILLDLMLPKKDGFEVLADIRSSEELKEIPVVVMTGCADDDDRARCDAQGIDTYITKPLNLEKFLSVIKKLKTCWREDVLVPSTD